MRHVREFVLPYFFRLQDVGNSKDSQLKWRLLAFCSRPYFERDFATQEDDGEDRSNTFRFVGVFTAVAATVFRDVPVDLYVGTSDVYVVLFRRLVDVTYEVGGAR